MNVLVISVHPDDETLGCGGTILKHRMQGDTVNWMIITEGVQADGYSREFLSERNDQVKAVSEAYQFRNVFEMRFPAARLHAVDFSQLLEGVRNVIQEVKPRVVYTVNRSDVHTDHQIAAKAVLSATKSFRAPFVKRVLMYECLSETEVMAALPESCFLPNAYSDISDLLEIKIGIMAIYESEVQLEPFPRSVDAVRALARFRGATVGVQYAEAFMLLRDVF